MRRISSSKFFIVFTLLLIAIVSSAIAQTPQVVINIEDQLNAINGPLLEVPINMELLVPSIEFYQVNLVIKYNSEALTPKSLTWYGYNYNYYFPDCQLSNVSKYITPDPDCDGSPCSTSLLHIQTQSYMFSNSCLIDSSLQLGSIIFYTHGDTGQFYPLEFYWDTCLDNSISMNDEFDDILVSNNVFDFNDIEITDNLPLPSYTGAPDDCVSGSGDTLHTRAIDFHSGGVQFIGIDTSLPARNKLYIEMTHSTFFDAPEYVSVYLNNNLPNGEEYQTFDSFELFIKYDTNVATFGSATAGQLMIDCGWEYMSWGHGSGLDCGGSPCPDGIIYIKGMAETDNGDLHPTCLADSIGELVVMNFDITDDLSYHCINSPIQFVWYDCSNNTITFDDNSDTLFISNEIFEYNSWGGSIRENHQLPTTYGAPYECLGEVTPGTTNLRTVDFYHGGFNLICFDSIDDRGDVNLNGIDNEIADWVLFTNYFYFGVSVFTVNIEAQIAATDVNADGIVLSLNDLMFMHRIIIGDTPPYPKSPTEVADTCFIIQNDNTNTVSIEYADSLTAVYLVFGDSIEPDLDFPNHTEGNMYVDPFTKILIIPDLNTNWLPEALLPLGDLFNYSGEGHLLSAEVSFKGTSNIPVVIQRVGTQDCCSYRGNADGVNGAGGPVNVADLTYLVNYIFKGGSAPVCIEEGNADGITNGGLHIDVADLTFLVNYIFKNGATPPSCP